MKKPTSNANDLYQIGNDYPQSPEIYFTSSYADGIYTEIKQTAYSAESKDGYDNSFFLGKIPDGLNKRVLNVPQKEWDAPVKGVDFDGDDISGISAVSAVFSPVDSIGTLTGFSAEKAAE
jgi:hypothetical protein